MLELLLTYESIYASLIKPLTSSYVAKYAIDCMFKNKMLIIPGFKMKCAKFFSRFISDKTKLKITYNIQKKKAS